MITQIRFTQAGAVALLVASVLTCQTLGQTNDRPLPSLPPVPDQDAGGELRWVRLGDLTHSDYVLVAPRSFRDNTKSSPSATSPASNATSRAGVPVGIPRTNVLAAVGQTQEETIKRCGNPTYWGKQNSTNTAQAVYSKEEPRFRVNFFTNKEGKRISGLISYLLPRELAQDKQLAEPVILKILEANADGHTWTEDAEDDFIKQLERTYRREGATATWFGGSLTVTIDEYSVFAEAERKRLAAEQAERIGGSVKK